MADFALCGDFSKVDVDERDEYNWTPLMGAVHQQSFQAVRDLLARGADVNAIGGPCTRDECTPLRIAVLDDNLPMAELLIRSGARVNACDFYGNTPLIDAAWRCNAPMLQLLIDAGATMERSTKGDVLDAFECVKEGAEELHADPAPAMKVLAAHWMLSSAQLGDFEGVSEALEYGGDINEQDENGRSPLFYAMEYLQAPDILALIRDRGADPAARDRHGMTPLHYLLGLCQGEDKEILPIVQVLLKAGIDVNARDIYGRTPIFAANTTAIAQTLANAGADVNARALDGATPLIEAQTGELVRFLVGRGADPCAMDDDQNTPLSQAIANFPDDVQAAQALVAAGADVNMRLWDGLTPLHLARSAAMVRFLIGAGADPAARDIEDRLPSETCAEWLKPEEIEEAFGKFQGFASVMTDKLQ